MYGLILVEDPANLLPSVDREFYVMQGDFYSEGEKGQAGHHEFNVESRSSTQVKMRSGNPDYAVFNGKVGALTGSGALTANTNETIRIFFGAGGPNLASSFHIIGEIFHKVYPEGSLAASLTNVQTTMVPAGGATIVEFTTYIMGTYLLVDHSLTRAIQKGAAAELKVTGPSAPDVYGFG
jgi:nitrite reductase (NO-forming)